MSQGETRHGRSPSVRSSLISNKYYDVVFIGSTLVSLATAALLAKKGQSVCFLDTTDLLESSVPDATFYYTLGPYLYFGFERGGAMEGFFSKLGLPIPNLKRDGLFYHRSNPSLQVVQSSHRLNVYSKKEDYADELKREFGKQIRHIKSCLEEVEHVDRLFYPFLGRFSQLELRGFGDRLNEWGQRRDFSNALGRHQRKSALYFLAPYPFDKAFLEYLDLHALFAYRKKLAEISSYELITLISGLQRGGVRVLGGCRTVIHFLQRLIEKWGGEVLHRKKVSDIEMAGKRLVEGIRLDDGSLLRGRKFIVSQSENDAVLHFYYHIQAELIPSPMKETLIMTWGSAPPKGFFDALIVRLSLAQEEEGFPSGLRGLSVTAIMQPGSHIDSTHSDHVKERVLDRLHWLIPFSKMSIKEIGRSAPLQKSDSLVGRRSLSSELERRLRQNTKSVSNGILNYLQPREGKNLFLLPSDFSNPVGGGASFLAAKSLADKIEKSK
ncbi:MAG: hypothetical protein ABGX83_02820 [Nitrospira sp.]|nr:hypothetical protein [Candidatus Manganitrophaceae bacterium]HIL34896.1 hypothetical protein [Candidatus Manganitrophaceae bacterium]